MPEAKRDEVPLPEPIEAQWRRHRYTEDQLREYGRQCAQAAVPVMPDAVREACVALAWSEDRSVGVVIDWLLSQNLIKE